MRHFVFEFVDSSSTNGLLCFCSILWRPFEINVKETAIWHFHPLIIGALEAKFQFE